MDSKKFFGLLIPRDGFYLWVILLLVGVIALLDWRVAIPGLVLFVFLIYYNISTRYKRKIEISSFIENLNFNIDAATKDTLLQFPMPLAFAETDGSLIWYNTPFKEISDVDDSIYDTIKSICAEVRDCTNVPGREQNGVAGTVRQIKIGSMHYNVLCNLSRRDTKKDSNNCVMIFYFIDITELVELKKQYADEKLISAIIVIDNYDDLMKSMEDTNRPQMLAEIDKRVVQWASVTNGIVRKYERDKYIFLFEQRYLKELEEKKFEILDTVKEINIGNKIPVTLSLGFGINGSNPAENFQYSAAAIDLALGRGGDQVVIKNGESFSFFGGKTREIEKRTKVKARVIAFALRELIDQASSVLIMGHENADIDSLGASMGLYRVVRSRDKNAYIVLDKVNPTIEKLMPKILYSDEYEELFIDKGQAIEMIDDKTLLIIVDTHRKSFTEVPELIEKIEQVVVIDHHRRGADYIQDTVLTYQETYASSASELVTELLQYIDENLKLNQIEAEALYAGIVVDTKNFTFKTGVRTFEAASYLKRQGVDTVSVKQLFQNDLETYLNISSVVSNAELVNGDIAISMCPAGMKNAQLIAAKAADELLNLSGIAAAFVLSSSGSEVWISGRSLGEVNVQVILEKLGGGGHLSVAGAQLTEISPDDAIDELKYAIMEYINELNKPNGS